MSCSALVWDGTSTFVFTPLGAPLKMSVAMLFPAVFTPGRFPHHPLLLHNLSTFPSPLFTSFPSHQSPTLMTKLPPTPLGDTPSKPFWLHGDWTGAHPLPILNPDHPISTRKSSLTNNQPLSLEGRHTPALSSLSFVSALLTITPPPAEKTAFLQRMLLLTPCTQRSCHGPPSPGR